MKKIILIGILVVPHIIFSQNFSLITNTDSIYVKVAGFGEKFFLTSVGNVSYDEVKIAFMHGDITSYYDEKFKELDIPLYPAEETDLEVQTTLITKLNTFSSENTAYEPTNLQTSDSKLTIEELNYRIMEFQKIRGTGYGLEIAGFLFAGISLVADSPELAIGGLAFGLAGVLVNASAGNKLRE